MSLLSSGFWIDAEGDKGDGFQRWIDFLVRGVAPSYYERCLRLPYVLELDRYGEAVVAINEFKFFKMFDFDLLFRCVLASRGNQSKQTTHFDAQGQHCNRR